MAYKFTSNMSQIDADTRRNISLAVRYTLQDIQDTSKEKTPKQFGDLRKNVIKKVFGTKGSIIWSQKYAAYQERGYTSGPVQRYTTQGTGAHFAENAVKEVVNQRVEQHLKNAGVIK